MLTARISSSGRRHRNHVGGFLLLVLVCAQAVASLPDEAQQNARRQAMVAEISIHAPDEAPIDLRVLATMGKVPRHRFVRQADLEHAYENRPLSIGHSQTISQPYIVALMTMLAQPEPTHKVLEIGTGSGYQAAVLADLAGQVYSLEIIEPLGEQASARLKALGYKNVQTRIADGYYGWPEAGPFDAIVVTAATSTIPPPLIQQLKPGGRLVIPVGGAFSTQTLMLVEKLADGGVRSTQVLPVSFVPLTGGH